MSIAGLRLRDAPGDRLTAGWSRLISGGLLAFVLVFAAVPASAQYRVGVGDVIEISVARVPELQRRVPVRSDGTISFPLLGVFRVAGLSPSEVEAKIQVKLATRVFRQRLSDGRENAVAIEPDEVTATVVQYRPIYVNGDVSKPGEQSFRPFMTVREAVALAGGYDILRVRTENPVLLSADLKGEYQSLRVEIANEEAHILRLRTELGEKPALDQEQGSRKDSAGPPSSMAEIMSVEREQLETEQDDYEREKTFLQHSIKDGDEQIKILSEQQRQEEQGVQADAQELQKDLELLAKGTLISPRVTDARRAVLLSSTRKLQTTVQLMQLRKQQGEVARQLQRLDDQRRIKLLQDLQDAGVKLSQFRAKLQSTAEKLQYTAARSQLAPANEINAQIAIIRKSEKGRERIDANADSELQPGDVVEIALRLDDASGLVPHKVTAGPEAVGTTAVSAERSASRAGMR